MFVASQAVVFTCLGLLQTASERYALPLLVMMHVGIALFISTQRSLRRIHPDVRRLVRATHVLMVLYLPVLLYKLLGRFHVVAVREPLLLGATLVLSLLALLLAVHSLLSLRTLSSR